MIVTSPTIAMSLSAFVAPDATSNAGLTTGGIQQAMAFNASFPAVTKVIAARINMGLGGATGRVALDTQAGTFTVTTPGTRQVETVVITAPTGCTTAGNLALSITGGLILGSPVAVSVPLTPATHPTAAAIAIAIANALNALSAGAFTNYYVATSSGAAVIITTRYPLANDGTLYLLLTDGLGVSNPGGSVNTTSGAGGAIVDFPSSSNKDAFGVAWPMAAVVAMQLRVSGIGSVSAISGGGLSVLPAIGPGCSMLWYAQTSNCKLTLEAAAPVIVDLLILGQ